MATESISETMTKKYEDLVNNIRELDQTFITSALIFFIVFIICLLLLYILYTNKLESRECSIMTKMYGDVNGKIKSNTADSSDHLCNYYVKTAYNCCSGGQLQERLCECVQFKERIETRCKVFGF